MSLQAVSPVSVLLSLASPQQLASSIAAAINEPVASGASAADTDGPSAPNDKATAGDHVRFLSPFNRRVGHALGGGDDDSGAGGDGSDDETAGAPAGGGGGGADADDDAEVMDRSKLKKISEKMLHRGGSRMPALPGIMLAGPGAGAGPAAAAGGVAAGVGRPATGAAGTRR